MNAFVGQMATQAENLVLILRLQNAIYFVLILILAWARQASWERLALTDRVPAVVIRMLRRTSANH